MKKEKNSAVFDFFSLWVINIINEILEEKGIAERIEKLKLKSRLERFYSKEKTELIEEIFTKTEEKLGRINERNRKKESRKPFKQRTGAITKLEKMTNDSKFGYSSINEEICGGVRKIVKNKLNKAIFEKKS